MCNGHGEFDRSAGMQRVAVQNGAKEGVKIGSKLEKLGFNLELLGSLSYIRQKLKTLTEKQVQEIKETLIHNPHLRLKRNFQSHLPYGTKRNFEERIRKVDPERLVALLKIVSFLLQTKVYLFWRKK